MPSLAYAASSTTLFACGAAAFLAWHAGLFANASLACLIAVWAAALRPFPRRALPAVEAALPAREGAELRHLRVTLDQVPAPLLARSAAGSLHALNRAARTLFGTEDRVAEPPGDLQDAIAAAVAGQRAMVRLPQSGGRSHSVSVASSFGPEGARILIVLRDVEAEIQEAEAVALRGLLAVLGHEIMNALTPVTSLAESAHAVLCANGPDGALQAREALAIILRRAESLDRFVQGYRQLAHVPPPVLRSTSVAQIVQDAAALFRARWDARQVALTGTTPSPDTMFALDAGLVGQALLSLLTNAAEWALAGPVAPHVWLDASTDGHGVTFRVRDNGPGVDPALADSIFQPFTTTKPGGSGIGLSLARQIAQSHGGHLTLMAHACPGAEFVMRF